MGEENTDLIRKEMANFVTKNPTFKRGFEEHEEAIIELLQQVPPNEVSKWIPAVVGAAMGIGLLSHILTNR
ncbi:MAG: hypothetical protein C5S52_08185 [ANME-2 cluster archaeon]|jgi:hypothetical protein|nr:hypothetical protein [ANME-2 cluster archaeon]